MMAKKPTLAMIMRQYRLALGEPSDASKVNRDSRAKGDDRQSTHSAAR